MKTVEGGGRLCGTDPKLYLAVTLAVTDFLA